MAYGGTYDTEGVSHQRRAVLASTGSALAAALAGCLGDDSDTDAGDETGADGDGSDEGSGTAEEDQQDDDRSTEPGADIEFVHPDTVQLDDQFSVEMHGLDAESVEVALSLTDFEQTEWTARATYEVDDGTLALDETAPVDREFGAGTMALLQRARADLGRGYAPHWDTGDTVTVSVVDGNETLASTSIDRPYGDLTWERVDSDEFVGWLSEPPGEEPLPGIIVLHGSGGQPSRMVTQMLAANGFAVLALQYFDWTGEEELLPDELVDVPLEFVENGAEWLLDRERVEGSQVGVWGASKGGELGLVAGSQFDDVGPVVSLNGSGYVWEGVNNQGFPSESSWTYDGEPLDYVPYVEDWELWGGMNPRELEPAYSASFEEANDDVLADAAIPVEECDGPVLLVSGGDDRLWNSVELHTVAKERLEANDREYEHLVYDDAGHAIRHPYLPATNREEGTLYVHGGTTTGYAEADSDHWPRVLETFETLRTD